MNEVTLRQALAAVWRGERPAELFIRGGTVVNVYSGELLPGHVAVWGGRIAYVGQSERALGPTTQVIEAKGRFVCPAFIEPHAHPFEWHNPVTLAAGIVPRGTTTQVSDTLTPLLHWGAAGFRAVLDALAEPAPMRLGWLVRISPNVQWPELEEHYSLAVVRELLDWPEVWGTAEVNQWPRWHAGDAHTLQAVVMAKARGKRSDGHTAGTSPDKLGALVAGGMSADHEAITAEEARERLRLGIWTMLRHSSLRPDLPELARLITRYGADTRRLCLTADGPTPAFVADHGYLDEALRLLVAAGVPAVTAIQMVTINPATYFGMDELIGGIAPGRSADLLILPDLEGFRPDLVCHAGRVVARDGELCAAWPQPEWRRFAPGSRLPPPQRLADPSLYSLPATGGPVVSIDLPKAVIPRRRDLTLPVKAGRADISTVPGLHYVALVDYRGRWVSRGLISGLFGDLPGLATSYQAAGNLLVVGRDPEAMARAAARVGELGSGLVFAGRDGITWEQTLPICAVATDLPWAEAVARHRELTRLAAAHGYRFADLLYSLDFLSSDFLPGLRLTPRGLVDVRSGEVLRPPDPIG